MNIEKVMDAISTSKEILEKTGMTVLGGNKCISEWDIEILERAIAVMKEHNIKFEAREMAGKIVTGIPSYT